MNGQPINRPTCNACKFAHTVSIKLNDPLECRGAPPNATMLPQNGQMVVFTAYPRVARQAPVCRVFEQKLAVVAEAANARLESAGSLETDEPKGAA